MKDGFRFVDSDDGLPTSEMDQILKDSALLDGFGEADFRKADAAVSGKA